MHKQMKADVRTVVYLRRVPVIWSAKKMAAYIDVNNFDKTKAQLSGYIVFAEERL